MADPVGWIYEDDEGRMMFSQMPQNPPFWEPVYRARKQWQGLTDEDLSVCDEDGVILARYWEAKLKAKYSDIVSDGGLDPRNKFDTAPLQREWQGLTENEIKHLWYEACQTNIELTSQLIVHLAKNIEAKLKEKNHAD